MHRGRHRKPSSRRIPSLSLHLQLPRRRRRHHHAAPSLPGACGHHGQAPEARGGKRGARRRPPPFALASLPAAFRPSLHLEHGSAAARHGPVALLLLVCGGGRGCRPPCGRRQPRARRPWPRPREEPDWGGKAPEIKLVPPRDYICSSASAFSIMSIEGDAAPSLQAGGALGQDAGDALDVVQRRVSVGSCCGAVFERSAPDVQMGLGGDAAEAGDTAPEVDDGSHRRPHEAALPPALSGRCPGSRPRAAPYGTVQGSVCHLDRHRLVRGSAPFDKSKLFSLLHPLLFDSSVQAK